MNLLTIKLKTGEEIVANVVEESKEELETFYLLENPVHVSSTGIGISAREWLYFSETNEVWISSRDMIYIAQSSMEGAEYYDRILEMRRAHERSLERSYANTVEEDEFSEEAYKEAEKIVAAYLESQNVTKH